MYMKKYLSLIIIFLLCISSSALANELNEDEVIVATNTKYYKTVTTVGFGVLNSNYNINNMPGVNNSSVSYEITEEEYLNGDDGLTLMSVLDGYVETTYKRMTSTIEYENGIYLYRVNLHWKNMPKVRSYDIIAIGHNATVQSVMPYFENTYCYSNGFCNTDRSCTSIYSGNNGIGIVFGLPSSTSVTSLDQMLEFNVIKNVNGTITNQTAYADYAHATSTVTSSNAANYVVNSTGIQHNASMVTSYDDIPTADALWQGTW